MSTKRIDDGERRYYRHGEAFWRDLIARQASSGQGIRGFCQAHGVASSTFHKWRSALSARNEDAGNLPVLTPDAAFLPIRHEQDMPPETRQLAAGHSPSLRSRTHDSVTLTIAGMRVELTGAHAERIVRHLLGRLGAAKC